MEKHATARGFCLCHLICVWYQTGRIGLYLGFYNVGYAEQLRRFICDEQLYVHIMAVVNLLASWLYLCFSQRWIFDQFVMMLYVPLYVYFLILRKHLTNLLNECAGIQKSMQIILGSRLCVKIHKECVYTLMLIVMFILLIIWQIRIYSVYQAVFISGVGFIYHLELLFFGNYLIWLGCIYRALNEFLRQDMRSDRLYILQGVLKQQTILWRVHRNVSRYFALHVLSFMIKPGIQVLMILKSSGQHLNVQMIHITLHLLLVALFLVIAYNLQNQHRKFQGSYLRLADDPNYFVLKSWRLLQHRTLPQAFGVTFMRRRKKDKYKKDVVSLMFSNNFPALQLIKTPLVFATFGLKNMEFRLTLTMLRICLQTHIRELLLLLSLRLLFHKNLTIDDYDYDSQDNFNGNVTQTISQLYRFYFYDEFE
ncbi:uncharacterized protein Grl62b [Drosophila kikkawai]|uniref:Uncharacterized protein Grl62b n=1 Tax=Drosophila kikkawai TaxID=30033 RepID=A0A6P4IJY6_DROKI|nr:uncharacterized protein LOC108075102 [Drosophila kikkawai]